MIDAPLKTGQRINPDGRAMRRMEKDATERIHAALQKWGRSLFRGVTADSVALITARLDDPDNAKPLRDAMIAVLQDVAGAGAEFGRRQVESAFMGVKAVDPMPVISLSDDIWTIANSDALQWAIEYGYSLIRGITNTTRAQVAREIQYFIDNSLTINQLRDRLMAGNLFSRNRAGMIATTEVTRAYAEGNTAAWKASKVVEAREWQTAATEGVCPLCGPLHGAIAKLGQPFPGGVMNPPRHVNCRCWVVPVVVGDEAVLSEVGVGPWGAMGQALPVGVPRAASIRDALNIQNMPAEMQQRMEAILGVIDSVHGTGDLGAIPLEADNAGARTGGYWYSGSKADKISISKKYDSNHQAFALVHEIGHFLDHQALGTRGAWNLFSNDALFNDWVAAVRGSKALQDIQSNPIAGRNKSTVKYLLSSDEVWARSYAQYIATRSNEPQLMAALRFMQKNSWSGTQWGDDDFEPIAAAMDGIFKALGWLR